jgi:hypothetical protein
MGTTRLIALVPALIVAVISQTGSNQLGTAFLVNDAPLIVELRTLIVELCTTRL